MVVGQAYPLEVWLCLSRLRWRPILRTSVAVPEPDLIELQIDGCRCRKTTCFERRRPAPTIRVTTLRVDLAAISCLSVHRMTAQANDNHAVEIGNGSCCAQWLVIRAKAISLTCAYLGAAEIRDHSSICRRFKSL